MMGGLLNFSNPSIDFYYAVISGMIGFLYLRIISHEATRKNFVIPWLNEQKVLNKYIDALTKLLVGLERFYGSAWSLKAFTRSFSLAYIYPLLFSLVAYYSMGVSNEFLRAFQPSSLENTRWFKAFLVFLLLSFYIVINRFFIVEFIEYYQRYIKIIPLEYAKIIYRVDIALISAGIVLYSGYNHTIVFLFLIFGLFMPTIMLAGAIAIDAGLGYTVTIFIVTVSSVVTGKFTSFGALVLSLVMAGVLAINGIISDARYFSHSLIIAILFILIPFLNAFLDWLSWGVTRYLLEVAKQEKGVWKILISILLDLILAIFLMLALCLLLPVGIEGLNWLYSLSDNTLFNWKTVVIEARNNPWEEGIMITMMLITTLIPTVLHLSMGLFAVLVNSFGGKKLIALLEEINVNKDNVRPIIATVWLLGYWVMVSLILILLYMIIVSLIDLKFSDLIYSMLAFVYDLPSV